MPLMYYEKQLKTMKDKTERVLDLIENPSKCGDVSIRKLFQDSDTAEIYRTITRTADALTETSEPDLNIEWNAFVEKNRDMLKTGIFGVLRNFTGMKIATLIIIALASLSLVAAGIGIGVSVSERKNKEELEINGVNNHVEEISPEIVEGTVKSEISTDVETHTMVYKDESLDSIINDIAHHYGCTVKYRTEGVKSLHLYFQWNRSQTLDETVSQLNHFQQLKFSKENNFLIVE